MNKKKRLGHSPFDTENKSSSESSALDDGFEVYETQPPAGTENSSDKKDEINLDNLISTILGLK